MAYGRTPGQKAHDFRNARIWETEVHGLFDPDEVIERFDSVDDIDLWFPGMFLELKEKNQPYGQRWHKLPGVPEQDLFIVDELSIRRHLQHYPAVFYLIRDNPQQRLFFAPIWELIAVERHRLNRAKKGKWVIDMGAFRQIGSPVEARPIAIRALAAQEWKRPDVASHKEVPQA